MAEKKRSYGCLLGGCLLLLVVGSALAIVGLVGGGALYWFGVSTPADIGAESAMFPAEEPAEPSFAEPPEPPPVEPAAVEAASAPAQEQQDLDAARSALAAANAYTPPPRSSPPAASSDSQPASSQPASSTPEPSAEQPAEKPSSVGSSQNVRVEGPASVVLVSSAGRFPVPGSVPPGRYEIEGTFPGDPPVTFGNLTVASGSTYTVTCNARMGICRGR